MATLRANRTAGVPELSALGMIRTVRDSNRLQAVGRGSARADAGGVQLTDRDVVGLVWCGEMYGARADLLAELLGASPDVVRRLHVRWRRADLAETGRLGPGPVWCWLTRAGLDACGLPYAAYRPPLGRLAHVHAVGWVRHALQTWPVYEAASARWRSERRLWYRMAARPSAGGTARRGGPVAGHLRGLCGSGVVRGSGADTQDGGADGRRYG